MKVIKEQNRIKKRWKEKELTKKIMKEEPGRKERGEDVEEEA